MTHTPSIVNLNINLQGQLPLGVMLVSERTDSAGGAVVAACSQTDASGDTLKKKASESR
jgi:hypothetical protein